VKEMDEKDFVVFYAWQSDSPTNTNRNFIESAAKAAIKQFQKTGVIDSSPRLDKDTKDVPGIPDIANTILDKIRSADVFLADLTYVGGIYEESGKPPADVIPNPNVMIELGYALAELGWERIVTVINTHYGSQENLPFDLRNRRWPLDYNLSPDAREDIRKEQKEKLVQMISHAINLIAELPPRDKSQTLDQRIQTLETTISLLNSSLAQQSRSLIEALQKNKMAEPEPKQRCAQNLAALIDRIQVGSFEDMPSTSPQLVITILPETPHSSLDIFGKNREELTTKLRPLDAYGWDVRTYGERLVTFSKPKNMINAVTELTIHGIINATGEEIISGPMEHFSIVAPETTKDTDVIPIMSVERSIIETVTQYCQALINLGVRGTLLVGFAIINLRKSILFVGARVSSLHSRVYEGNKIIPPPVEIPEGADFQNPQTVAKALRPAFDFIWREYNYQRSLNYGSTGEWGGLPGM
jgi:hypothetical protein